MYPLLPFAPLSQDLYGVSREEARLCRTVIFSSIGKSVTLCMSETRLWDYAPKIGVYDRAIGQQCPLLLTGGNTAVGRRPCYRRDGAYRGTAPIVLARLAICSYDALKRLLERFGAHVLMVWRIS